MKRMNSFNSGSLKREQLILEARMVENVKRSLRKVIREASCEVLDDDFCNSENFSSLFLNISFDTLLGLVVDLRIRRRKEVIDAVNIFLTDVGVPESTYRDFKKSLPKLIDDNMLFFDTIMDDDIYYLIDMYIDYFKDSLVLVNNVEDTKYTRYALSEARKKGYTVKFESISTFVGLDNYNSAEFEEIESPNIFIYYIENYKELNNMADKYGFKLKRIRGDHAIYENSEGMVTVIPQRTPLGKGLSFAIQKTLMGK